MPQPRSSNSSRSGKPTGKPASSGGGIRKKTAANERRAPARPRGENPYARAAKGEAPRGTRGSTSKRGTRDAKPVVPAGQKKWGSLTRKGAVSMREDGPGRESSRQAERIEKAPERGPKEQWITEKSKPSARTASQKRPTDPFQLPKEATIEIEERAGKKADRLIRSLREASKAYAAERWGDCRKSLRPLLLEVGDAPVVMELHGMLLYRTGKWAAALKELEAAHKDTQSYDLYPAMMDCHRALKRPKKVTELWDELRQNPPSGEVMAEGRIVMAATMAEQDRLQDAIRLLEKTPKVRSEPKPYHLRSWYATADLYERSGDVGKARALFQRIAKYDPDLADVADRLDTLA